VHELACERLSGKCQLNASRDKKISHGRSSQAVLRFVPSLKRPAATPRSFEHYATMGLSRVQLAAALIGTVPRLSFLFVTVECS
jgi:hypothetical protein